MPAAAVYHPRAQGLYLHGVAPWHAGSVRRPHPPARGELQDGQQRGQRLRGRPHHRRCLLFAHRGRYLSSEHCRLSIKTALRVGRPSYSSTCVMGTEKGCSLKINQINGAMGAVPHCAIIFLENSYFSSMI